MAETLGSLCDKLTVVKLKQFHTKNNAKLDSLSNQEKQLREEINELISAAVAGDIPVERLHFSSNKIYKRKGNDIQEVTGSVGEVVAHLADVNCRLWHEQEKVYEFEKVPMNKKNTVVKNLALLNLERTRCIDAIDRQMLESVQRLLKPRRENASDAT